MYECLSFAETWLMGIRATQQILIVIRWDSFKKEQEKKIIVVVGLKN